MSISIKNAPDCVQDCLECHRICFQTAMNYCLERGGSHTMPAHFRLMMNCADISKTTASFLMSESEWDFQIRSLCTEICEACAHSCEQAGGMDECVAACRRCAKSCRQVEGAFLKSRKKSRLQAHS